MVLRYAGTLPCGDCKGIRTVLTLYSDPNPTRYELRETYVGTQNGNQTFISWGRWMIANGIANDKDAVVYQLASDRPNQTRSYLKDGDHELILLDRMRGVVSPRNPPLLVAVPAEAVNPVVITERSPNSIQIREGDWVIFRFGSNTSSGLRWTIENSPGPGLTIRGKSIYTRSATTQGQNALGCEIWSLSATQGGEYRLNFLYRRPWEPLSPVQKKFQFTLEVLLKG
jgi:predicted secreted protein